MATVIPPPQYPRTATSATLAALAAPQHQYQQQHQHQQQPQPQNTQPRRFLYPDQCLPLTDQQQQQLPEQHSTNPSAAPLLLQPTSVTSVSLTIPAGAAAFTQSGYLPSGTSAASPSSPTASSSRHGSTASATLSLVSQALLEICEGWYRTLTFRASQVFRHTNMHLYKDVGGAKNIYRYLTVPFKSAKGH